MITLMVGNGCVDTTVQFPVEIFDVALPEIRMEPLLIAPNPGSGVFTVTGFSGVMLQLLDATGRILMSGLRTDENGQLHLQHLPAGVYLLRDESTAGRTVRLILQK